MQAMLDVTPVFLTDPNAPPGNVVPALARLLIDVARRNLTNEGPPIMLEECNALEMFPVTGDLQHGQ